MRCKLIPSFFTGSVVLFLVSCSNQPSGPQPGTAAFYWASARQTFLSGDYVKTSDNLDRATKSSEYAAKALPWSMIVDAGLIRGYMELADDYEQGARANRTNPGPFRRQASNYRRLTRGLTSQLAEKFRDFQKINKDDQVSLAFPFPSGTQASPPLLGKILQGIFPPEAELEDAQKLMLRRAIILEAADATGTAEDSSKAQELFKSGEVKVPRSTFMLAMGRALINSADLYNSKKLDEPERARMFAEAAREAVKGMPESKDLKALNEKINKVVKPSRKSS